MVHSLLGASASRAARRLFLRLGHALAGADRSRAVSLLDVPPRERPRRRSVEHGAVDAEARTVARAVPRLLGAVNLHEAAEMGAPARPRVQRALRIAIRGEPLTSHANR